MEPSLSAPAPEQPASKAQAPSTPTAHTTGKAVDYESNPFRVSITGLITLLKVNPIASLLLAIVLALIIFGAIVVGAFFSIIPVVGPLVMLAIMLLAFPIAIGAYHALAVSSIKGETRTTSDFIGITFKKAMPLLGASVLIGLVVFLGFLLLIVPGIIFASWFSLTFFVMFDENLGAIASMKRSKELVSGHILEIIGASIAGGLMSGTSAGGGGGLLSPAITIAPMAGRYQQLKALKASGQPKPKVHWLNYTILIVCVLFLLILIPVYTLMVISGVKNESNKSNYNNTFQTSDEEQLEQQLKNLNRKYDLNNDSTFTN
jgi:hypothetical protein